MKSAKWGGSIAFATRWISGAGATKQLAVAGVAALVMVGDARAQSDGTQFYAGKTVELIVPYGTGGGNDITARFVAPLLSRHIEGNPSVQVVNMPGSETVIGGNAFERADRDGLTWILTGSSTTFQEFMGNDNAEFTLRDWRPMVSFAQGGITYGSKDLDIADVCDLDEAAVPLWLGAQGTDGASILRILALHMLEVDYQLIPGYESAAPKRTALLQGEISINGDGTVVYNSAIRPEVEAGNVIPLYAYGFPNSDGGLDRDPAAPDIRTLAEAYECLHDKPLEGPLLDIYMSLVPAQAQQQRTFFMHRDDPQEAVEAVRDGIKAAMQDPEWIEARDTVFEGYVASSEGLEGQLNRIISPDPGMIAALDEWLAEIGFPRN